MMRQWWAAAGAGHVSPTCAMCVGDFRFLMIKPGGLVGDEQAVRLIVVEYWFEELKRRVPAGK